MERTERSYRSLDPEGGVSKLRTIACAGQFAIVRYGHTPPTSWHLEKED